jgi:hypothetical protein
MRCINLIKQEIRRKTLLSCRLWAKPRVRRSLRPSNPSAATILHMNSTRGYYRTAGTIARNPNSPTNQPQILQSPSPRIAIHNTNSTHSQVIIHRHIESHRDRSVGWPSGWLGPPGADSHVWMPGRPPEPGPTGAKEVAWLGSRETPRTCRHLCHLVIHT